MTNNHRDTDATVEHSRSIINKLEGTTTPAEARDLINKAEKISRQTHDAVRWPYIAFILALGMITSFGSLAMAITEGQAFGVAYVATLIAFFAVLMFFFITTKGKIAFAWSKRWVAYIAAWAVTYAAAIAVVAFLHGSLLWAGIASGLILVVTFTSALIEAKR